MSEPAVRSLALVTGASSGIGLELAKQFAEHGFDLFWRRRTSSSTTPSRCSGGSAGRWPRSAST
ncbi:SDR family NAD(P)-dependent oxidoreductase [Blastococcus sp. CT_GayMR19]|uniref:SDR family NAD(P)-dependent oxidoreductase n=1 Tax=Blastococcus sp. CT_GayMR19 TaxID=2559608 RepID=UPI001FD85B5D|nr:SDR family NAD(P)-dependent oxidoreductase [Blastococcus sp. CT_GayMR19]